MKTKYILATVLGLAAETTQANENAALSPETNKITKIIDTKSKEIADVYRISKKDFVLPETTDTIMNQDQNLERGEFDPEKFVVTIKNIINTGTTIELEKYMNELTKNDIKALQQYLITYKDEVNTGEYPIGSTIQITEQGRTLGGGALSLQIKKVIDTENSRVQAGVDRESGQPFFFLKPIKNGIEIIMKSNRITNYPKMENGEYFYEKEEFVVDYSIVRVTYEGDRAYIQIANDFENATYTEKKETNASKTEREKTYTTNQTLEENHQKIYNTYEKNIQEYKLSAKNEKDLINTLKDLSKKNQKNNEAFTTDAEKLMKKIQEYKKIENGEKDYKKYSSTHLSFSTEEQAAINDIETAGLGKYLRENIGGREKKAVNIYTKIFKYLDIKSTNNDPGFTPLDMSTATEREKLIKTLRETVENIKLAANKGTIKEEPKDIEECIKKIEIIISIINDIGGWSGSDGDDKIKKFFKENF